ncbi:MAG: hypothetical protein ACKVJK_12355, partial [Methylophagaceae bacterium]
NSNKNAYIEAYRGNINFGGDAGYGNVGIGTNSPDAPLSIYDADLTTTGGSGVGGIRVHRPGSFGQFGYMEYGYGSSTTYIGSSYTGSTAAVYGAIHFRQHSNGGTPLTSMVLNSVGNVGIGITDPATSLHVDAQNGTTYPTLGPAGGSLGLSINELHGMYLGVDGSSGNGWVQAMREDGTGTAYNLILQPSGGNVGIGTDSPGQKLVVQGSNHIATLLNTSTANNAYSQLMLQAGSSTNYIWTQNENSTNYGGAHSLNIYTQQAGPIAFFTGGNNERMRIDGTGHIGIGVVPESGWSTTATVLQFGESGALWGDKSGEDWSYFSSNTYWDGTNFKYKNTNQASYYVQDNQGEHVWAVAPSGTADANITFNQAMKLDQSGKLLLGTTNIAPGSGDVAGSVISPDGYISVSRTSVSAEFNRIGSNGDIIVFRKGGDLVGSWQARGDVVSTIILDPRTNGAGLTATANTLYPTSNTGAIGNTTALVDLGTSGYEFRNLYLSGGALTSTVKFLANTTVSGSDATIFRPADNTMAFSTNGAERMRIDASGFVGINTAGAVSYTPLTLETASGSAFSAGGVNGVGLMLRNRSSTVGTSSGIKWAANTSYHDLGGIHMVLTGNSSTNETADLTFFTSNSGDSGNTEKMRITSNGDVGIGTSDASDTAWGAVGANKALTIDGTTGYANIHFRSTYGTPASTRFSQGVGDGNFYMAYDRIAGAHRITVKSDGKVGIGTTDPGQKLHVSGNIELNSISTASSGDMDKILFRKAHTSGASTGLYDMAELRSYTSNGYAGGLDFYTGRSTGGGNYGSTFAMRINDEGNVGIGITAPATPLHVRNVGNPNSGGNRNTVETVLTLDSTGHYPYAGYGVGIDFKGEDYGNTALREYAKIQAVMTDSATQNSSGDPSFRSALTFWTNNGGASGTLATEKMRITSAGDVSISDGNLSVANGHGIDFSATPNSATTGTTHTSSLLDDYEEGYWTPILIGSSGTFTNVHQLGSYTKIGNLIHLTFYVGATALGTATGVINIGNLPYAASGGGTTNNR